MIQYAVPIEGVVSAVEQAGGSFILTVRSEKPLYCLSTGLWQGGFGMRRLLFNRQVHHQYMSDDPERETQAFLERCGYPELEAAGMLTAAQVADAGYTSMELDGIRVCCWVTAGFGNAARAGSGVPAGRLFPGTINTMLLIEGTMSDEAMAGALITATEAKAAALQQLGVMTGDGETATGTTTDAVIVATTGTGLVPFRYAGTATVVGHLIGRAVYEAFMLSGQAYLRRR
ncbi:adenosylcobinamide amidohydrolase [Paenibacillus sp. y28]|uniref:adenosylcobinamide amidohydrolase n=1 Tax=Paenibacillus sp. y28 TaxID=3129110 RepID=UPI00301A8272